MEEPTNPAATDSPPTLTVAAIIFLALIDLLFSLLYMGWMLIGIGFALSDLQEKGFGIEAVGSLFLFGIAIVGPLVIARVIYRRARTTRGKSKSSATLITLALLIPVQWGFMLVCAWIGAALHLSVARL